MSNKSLEHSSSEHSQHPTHLLSKNAFFTIGSGSEVSGRKFAAANAAMHRSDNSSNSNCSVDGLQVAKGREWNVEDK